MSDRRNGMDNSRTYMLNYKQIIFRIHMKRKMRLILSYSLGQMKTEEFEKTRRHCKKRNICFIENLIQQKVMAKRKKTFMKAIGSRLKNV